MCSNDGVRGYESCSPGSIGVRQLVLLFSLALLPRITGLVTFKNPDELWGPSVRVLTGDLSAGTSQTLPLVNYLNAASFVPLYAIGRLVGVWQGTADFRAQYFRDPTPFIFAGRFVTACFGALSAPLAVLIAGHLGLTRRSSLIVGCMVALFPINVWLSHVAKPDSGVATAILLVAWSLLRRLDGPPAMGADILVGFAFAFAVSFKQTAIFLVAPLFVGFVALLRLDCGLPWARIARGLLVTLAASICAWVPMSIGVLLDIKGFLEWQRLALISVERAPSAIGQQIADVGSLFAGNITGLTAAGLVAWLVAPFVRRDRKFLVLWGSSAFGLRGDQRCLLAGERCKILLPLSRVSLHTGLRRGFIAGRAKGAVKSSRVIPGGRSSGVFGCRIGRGREARVVDPVGCTVLESHPGHCPSRAGQDPGGGLVHARSADQCGGSQRRARTNRTAGAEVWSEAFGDAGREETTSGQFRRLFITSGQCHFPSAAI